MKQRDSAMQVAGRPPGIGQNLMQIKPAGGVTPPVAARRRSIPKS
jgi:hypothetical protein